MVAALDVFVSLEKGGLSSARRERNSVDGVITVGFEEPGGALSPYKAGDEQCCKLAALWIGRALSPQKLCKRCHFAAQPKTHSFQQPQCKLCETLGRKQRASLSLLILCCRDRERTPQLFLCGRQ
jgi:hypothetical protein